MKKNKLNILFVCGRNKWRSPTAERLFRHDQRCNVRSAGVSVKSARQVSNADLEWADLVLVMESGHKARILGVFRDLDLPPIHSLDIPDEYQFMDPELMDMIRISVEYHLNKVGGDERITP